MSNRALVTGGAGFIGSNLVRALLDEGAEVVVLDNLSTGSMANLEAIAKDIEFIEGSILDPESLERAVKGVERVFHLAAQVSVPASMTDPEHNDAVNCRGTQQVFEAARAAGARRVVLALQQKRSIRRIGRSLVLMSDQMSFVIVAGPHLVV